MELAVIQKLRKSFGKRSIKIISIGVIIVIILGAGSLAIVKKTGLFNEKATMQQRTARVERGSISVSVSGSGPINSSNESQVTSSVTGKITKISFKEGDSVKAGELLFEIDDSDAKLNVEKIKNSIAQAKLAADTNSKSLKSLTVYAPYDGQITDVADLKVGDEVNKGSAVLTITDVSRLRLKVSFSSTIANKISAGKKVTVNIQDLMQSVDGTVTYISSKPTTTGSGGTVYDAEISVANPGSLKAGMQANAEVDLNGESQMSTSAGQLEYADTQVIRSVSGGTVTGISVKENQFVKAGQTLIGFSNDDLQVSAETNNLKMQDLESQLETAEKQLSEYKIYAPLDGIIVSQDLKVGNSVKPADVLCTITDPSHMEFEVSVDELDISRIQVGQNVSITVDALTETSEAPLSGQVSKIAIEGTSSNGVTTYPVTINVKETDNLKVGMNANAEILVNEKSDILLVPIEAIQKKGDKSFVMVKTGENIEKAASGSGNNSGGSTGAADDSRNDGGPKASAGGSTSNTVLKPVEVGINNDTYIEIVSGLQEGEEIVLPAVSSGSETTDGEQQQGGMGAMNAMGAIGGGGPGGGAPDGGGPGGGAPGGLR